MGTKANVQVAQHYNIRRMNKYKVGQEILYKSYENWYPGTIRHVMRSFLGVPRYLVQYQEIGLDNVMRTKSKTMWYFRIMTIPTHPVATPKEDKG